jgi:CMP-N-acetylneuraminic acid synthetase
MKIVIIPAKGGSTRLPNKNMHLLNGRPLIEYTLDYIKKCKQIDDVYVTTDNEGIIKYCRNQNIKVIKRPVTLGGETPIIDVYKHAFQNIAKSNLIEILIGLQVDHPDRTISLEETLKIFDESQVDRLFSKDKNGIKNGAHYILSKYFLINNISRKDITVTDDCTNIHYLEDLKKAELNLK